ncbi:Map microtubule affinity-regulating kinase [Rhizophlyctis rosea]|nr:Map microtubule affinity-regulating kinase [Rhizophlyctis rosea]
MSEVVPSSPRTPTHPKLSVTIPSPANLAIPRPATPTQPRSPISASSESSPASDLSCASPDAESGPYLDRFMVQRVLGEGSYGKVKLAYDMVGNRTVALKIIQKSTLKKTSHITRLKREVRIMRLLHHPNITQLYDVIETEREIVLVMEHVEGGELFDYIVAHKRLKEKIARRLFRQIVSAVDYCHQSSIIHRDLKPENILLDNDRNVKIIDFGFVKLYDREDMLKTFCGSPFYASPEMILGKQYIGPEVDIWSMGVILFALLNGHLPFRDANTTELYRKISHGVYETQTQYMTPVSADLIKMMLTVDPENRASLEIVRRHPWVNEGYDGPPESLVPPRPKAITDPDALILGKFPMYGFETNAGEENLKSGANSGPYFSLYCLLKESAELALGLPSPTSPVRPHGPGEEGGDAVSPERGRVPERELSTTPEDPTKSPSTSKSAALRRGSTSLRRPSLLSGRREGSVDSSLGREERGHRVPISPLKVRGEDDDRQYSSDDDGSKGKMDGKLKRRASTSVSNQLKQSTVSAIAVSSAYQENQTRHASLPRRARAGTDAGVLSGAQAGSGGNLLTPSHRDVAGGSAQGLPSISALKEPRPRRQSALAISAMNSSTISTRDQSKPDLQSKHDLDTSPSSTSGTATPTRGRDTRKRSIADALTTALHRLRSPARSRRSSLNGLAAMQARGGEPLPVGTVPRTSKAIYGADTTSTKPPDEIVREIERVLAENSLKYVTEGYKLTCTSREVTFQIEVSRIKDTGLHALEMKRVKGTSVAYQSLLRTLIGQWKL